MLFSVSQAGPAVTRPTQRPLWGRDVAVHGRMRTAAGGCSGRVAPRLTARLSATLPGYQHCCWQGRRHRGRHGCEHRDWEDP